MALPTLIGLRALAMPPLSNRRRAERLDPDVISTMTKPVMGTIDNFPAERLTGYRLAPTSAVTVAANGSLNGQNWWSTPPSWGTTFFNSSAGGGSLAPSPW
jgi:hypothetical protein